MDSYSATICGYTAAIPAKLVRGEVGGLASLKPL